MLVDALSSARVSPTADECCTIWYSESFGPQYQVSLLCPTHQCEPKIITHHLFIAEASTKCYENLVGSIKNYHWMDMISPLCIHFVQRTHNFACWIPKYLVMQQCYKPEQMFTSLLVCMPVIAFSVDCVTIHNEGS